MRAHACSTTAVHAQPPPCLLLLRLYRVKALDLGPLNTGSQPLQGSISPELGALTELLLLDLSGSKLK